MFDEKGPDAKILCVPVSDPIWNQINQLEDVNPHLLKEIEHFFQVYKDLEKKKVGIEGWDNQQAAIRTIREAKKRYHDDRMAMSHSTI
jgi:inorganic pyrophosphatase